VFPARKQLQQAPGVFGFAKLLQQVGIAEQLGDLGKKFEVIFIALLRNRHGKQQVHGLSVDGVEG
jgi:hypothetical protein